MNSVADGLPPEIARQIQPAWRKNEADYWAAREHLLSQYHDQWIGFADAKVIASGTRPVAVFQVAEATGRNPFVTCVGREDEPTRLRRASFAYDRSYPIHMTDQRFHQGKSRRVPARAGGPFSKVRCTRGER